MIKRCLLSIEVNQVMFSAHHLSPDQIKPLGRQNIGFFFCLWINITLQRSLRASLGHSTKLNCRTFDSFKIGPLVIWNYKTCNKPKVWYLETKSFHHFDSYKSIDFYNYSRPKVFKSIHVPILQVNQSNEKSELPERFFNPVIKPVRGLTASLRYCLQTCGTRFLLAFRPTKVIITIYPSGFFNSFPVLVVLGTEAKRIQQHVNSSSWSTYRCDFTVLTTGRKSEGV